MKLPIHIALMSILTSLAPRTASEKYVAIEDTLSWVWEKAYQIYPAPRNYIRREEIKHYVYEAYKEFCHTAGALPAKGRVPEMEAMYPDAVLFMPDKHLFHLHPEIIARGRNPQTGEWLTVYTIDRTTRSKQTDQWINSPQGEAYMEMEVALGSILEEDEPPKTYVICKLHHHTHKKHVDEEIK